MSLDLNTPNPLIIPTRKRRLPAAWLLLPVLAFAAGLWAWGSGFRPSAIWANTAQPIALVEVDQGDLTLVVTENGSLESAKNTTARCQVEALIGLVGGAQGGANA